MPGGRAAARGPDGDRPAPGARRLPYFFRQKPTESVPFQPEPSDETMVRS